MKKTYQVQVKMMNENYEEWYLRDQFNELNEDNLMLFDDEVNYQKRTKNDITAQHCSVVLVEVILEDDEEIEWNILKEENIK